MAKQPMVKTAPVPLADMAGAIQSAANGGQPIVKMDDRSQDNRDMQDHWRIVAALTGGLATMQAGGKDYLPAFPAEDNASYDFRLSLAKLTNIHNDIISSLADKPFENETTLAEDDGNPVPEEFAMLTENMDGAGNNLTRFAHSVFIAGIRNVLDWIMVDYPETEPGKTYTVAEGKAANIRPFFSRVDAPNMLEVRSQYISGAQKLTYARILEPGKPRHVRVFELLDGIVSWQLWRKLENRDDWVKDKEGVLSIDVIPLVPFITGEREDKSWCFIPPLRDMVELQKCLYRQETNLEHLKAVAAFPMLSGNGVRPPMEADGVTIKKIRTGPNSVLYAPPDGNGNSGSWAYVEPSANTLKFLSEDIDKTKKDLRELGKQPLSAQSGNITVITAGMAAGKSRATVKAWGKALVDALENAFVIAGKFMGIPETQYSAEVVVYDDYDNVAEGDVAALGTARNKGDISRKTYLRELQRRSILSAEFDEEADADDLLEETPSELINDIKKPVKQPGK